MLLFVVDNTVIAVAQVYCFSAAAAAAAAADDAAAAAVIADDFYGIPGFRSGLTFNLGFDLVFAMEVSAVDFWLRCWFGRRRMRREDEE